MPATPPYAASMRRAGPGLLLALVACGRNPAFDAAAASSPDPGVSTGLASTTAPLAPTTGPALPGSTGDATTTGSTGAVLDPTTTDASTSAASTTDASTGFPEPTMEEHLQSYQTENCKNPLWCLDEGQPSPARASAQLCFAPATAPPYLLDRIGWVIAANFGDLTADSYLEVYTGTAAGPDQKLWELPLGPGEVSAVPHAYVFGDDPIVIPTPIFCVGLVAGSNDPGGSAVGLGVDPTQPLPGRSYLDFAPGAACETDGWADLTTYVPGPNGVWCLDATIRGN
mgnify:CR=1 FL=1